MAVRVSLYSQRIRQNENMTTGGRENILLRVLTMYGVGGVTKFQ